MYLEKDYWICRSLKMLSESKEKEVAVFKGGTSLSKAYRLGNRFSEDIDIVITSDQARFKEPDGWTFSPVIVRCGAAGEAVADVVAKYNSCLRPEGREFMGDGIAPPAGL